MVFQITWNSLTPQRMLQWTSLYAFYKPGLAVFGECIPRISTAEFQSMDVPHLSDFSPNTQSTASSSSCFTTGHALSKISSWHTLHKLTSHCCLTTQSLITNDLEHFPLLFFPWGSFFFLKLSLYPFSLIIFLMGILFLLLIYRCSCIS